MSGKEFIHRLIAAVTGILLLLAVFFPKAALAAAPTQPNGPRLMRLSPSGPGLTVGRDVTVVLSFDRPMDAESIARAASFEPQVPFTVSGEAECLIVPSNLLPGSREYTFRLGPGKAQDRRGRVFDAEVQINFSTRNDGMMLEAPDIPFSGVILEGSDPDSVVGALGSGVGHYPGTGRPGGGNFVLMAHASGQISFPFNNLQNLKNGDEISVHYGAKSFIYQVEETMVVEENAMWILDPKSYPMVTIFVCSAADGKPSPTLHPPYRYVVRAALASTSP
jgi:LPXTG-site transpeptidase (sortase) family protein